MFSPAGQELERGWPGKIEGDRVVQLAAQTLQSFFTGGGKAREHAEFPLAEVKLLPPIPDPPKIVCVGLNYRDHAEESGAPIPKEPVLFSKFTTALTAHSLEWLSQHPDQRELLSKQRETLLDPATEEFLRYFTPAPGDGRTFSDDVELDGITFKEGERLWISWAMANRDPAVFQEPDEIVLDRKEITFVLDPSLELKVDLPIS